MDIAEWLACRTHCRISSGFDPSSCWLEMLKKLPQNNVLPSNQTVKTRVTSCGYVPKFHTKTIKSCISETGISWDICEISLLFCFASRPLLVSFNKHIGRRKNGKNIVKGKGKKQITWKFACKFYLFTLYSTFPPNVAHIIFLLLFIFTMALWSMLGWLRKNDWPKVTWSAAMAESGFELGSPRFWSSGLTTTPCWLSRSVEESMCRTWFICCDQARTSCAFVFSHWKIYCWTHMLIPLQLEQLRLHT